MKKLYYRILLLLGAVAAVIFITDRTGIFEADLGNNHEKASWNAFYDFTKDNEVDVLLVGNSHLYTGINPNHLSCLLGANCFILAGSGAPVIDVYYALEEALTRCTPKLVVLETYCIDDKRVREQKEGNLSNEFKSFASRRNIPRKLLSTPVLFSSDNYLSAWSTSVRNHDFIFKYPKQIALNLEGKNVLHRKSDLELGRFTRFTSGITARSDSLYDVLGPVVDGDDFKVNRESYGAVKKIQAICRKKGIPLVYLTVPMYHKHVANYGSWKTIVSRVLGPDANWLDLQDPYDYRLFDKDCFEDTRKDNQHTSALGARICDYKLADFIIEKSGVSLPDRHREVEWRKLFRNEEGYFEHYSPDPDDTKNLLLCGNASLGGLVLVKDCVLAQGEEKSLVLMKVDKGTDPNLLRNGIELLIGSETAKGKEYYSVVVRRDPGTDPHDHYLLVAGTSINGLKSARLESARLLTPVE